MLSFRGATITLVACYTTSGRYKQYRLVALPVKGLDGADYPSSLLFI